MEESKSTVILRYVLTGLITVVLFVVVGIKNDVNKIDTKLFEHLTNSEIHVPREYVTSKAEFIMYKEFCQQGTNDIKEAINDLKDSLK